MDTIKKNLDNSFYVYAPEYYPWCFEIHLLNFIVQVREKNDLIHPIQKMSCFILQMNILKNLVFFNYLVMNLINNISDHSIAIFKIIFIKQMMK